MRCSALLASAAALGLVVLLQGDIHVPWREAPREPRIVAPDELSWEPAPGFPPGAEMAVLEGDPETLGRYTLRLRFPARYSLPPHTHGEPRHVTVLWGALRIGAGRTIDPATIERMAPGAYLFVPPGVPIHASVPDVPAETVLQVHGDGPFRLDFVFEEDDPRRWWSPGTERRPGAEGRQPAPRPGAAGQR